MDIREIDVDDDAVFNRFYAIIDRADRYGRPEAPRWSEREMAVMFRKPDNAEVRQAFGAFDDDEMVGAAFIMAPQLDNTMITWNGVFVVPELRRRGIGGALADFTVEQARRLDRPVVLGESSYDFAHRENHPYRMFAEKHGFTLANTEVARRLDLPVAEERIFAWIDEAAREHAAYTIETYVDVIPEPVLASFCHVINQLALDAPSGDIEFEAEQMTPEVWRQREATHREQGRRRYDSVALDAAGNTVAVTTLVVPEHDRPKVYQWATLVLREHRGHRLGLAVKARNLLEVQRAHPDRRAVYTSNGETNGPMVDINAAMGFVPVEILAEWQRKL